MKKITKISILTILLSNSLSGFSLEESLLSSNAISNKKEVIKKEYYKENSNYYDLKMSKLKIINHGSGTDVMRFINNINNKRTIDILIKPYQTEEIEIPIGNYNVKMFYSNKRSKFLNFKELFGESTTKFSRDQLISFNVTKTFKHLCKGKFSLNTTLSQEKPSFKESYNMVRTKEEREFGECMQDQTFNILENKNKNIKEINNNEIKTNKKIKW